MHVVGSSVCVGECVRVVAVKNGYNILDPESNACYIVSAQ